MKKKLKQKIANITWLKQMLEASRDGGRTTIILATFFINVASLAFPLMIMQVYDRIIPSRSYSTMFLLFTGVIIALLLELTVRISRAYINLWNDTKYEHKLSMKGFNKLMDEPLKKHTASDAGSRLQQINTLDQMKGFYNNQLFIGVFDVPFVVIFLGILGYLGGWLVLIPLILVIGLALISYYLMKNNESTLQQKILQKSRENNFIIEVLNNIHTVKSIGMETLFLRRYEHLQNSNKLVNYHSSVEAGDLITLKMIASQLVVILIVAFGSLHVIAGTMTIGGLAACTLLVGRVMQPINRALGAFNHWQTISVVRQQLDIVLNLPTKADLPSFGEISGNIELKNVKFRYHKDTPWILKGINLTMPPKTIIGIAGREQSGKTTFMNILARIIDPTEGEYLIDGRDVTQFEADGFRKQVAYLGQSGDLFHGSIIENLSAFDEDLIPIARRLAKALGLEEIIAKLPNGFNTPVGDRSVESLPHGIIRRLIIIRTLVQKPKLVLFDEADVNLDVRSYNQLLKILYSLKQIATVVLISHRLSTLRLASILFELHNGELRRIKTPEPKQTEKPTEQSGE